MKPTYPVTSLLLRSCCLIWICLSVPAQDASFIWAQKLPSDSETIRAIAPTTDGSFITLAGPGSGTNTISRVTEQGAVDWSVRFPPAAVLATAPDGAAYLGGYAISCPPMDCPLQSEPADRFVAAGIQTEGDGYGYVARLNPDGVPQWVRLDGKAPRGMIPRGLAIDKQSNYYVAGWYNGEPAELGGVTLPPGPSANNPPNSFFAKYASTGHLEWVRVAVNEPAEGFNNLNSIAVDSSGNLFVAGIVDGNARLDDISLIGPGFYLIKISPTGTVLWAREVSQDCCSSVKVASDSQGNSFMALRLENGVLALFKYNPQGDLLWTRTSGGEGGGNWAGIGVEENGDCVLAGDYDANISFGNISLSTVAAVEAFAVKFTSAGEVKWALSSVGADPDINFAARISIARPAAFASNDRKGYLLAGSLTGTTIFGSTKLIGPPSDGTFEQFLTLVSAQASAPHLQIVGFQEKISVSWPANAIGYVLQSSNSLSSGAWSVEPSAPVLSGDQMVVTIQPESSARFFRLKRP